MWRTASIEALDPLLWEMHMMSARFWTSVVGTFGRLLGIVGVSMVTALAAPADLHDADATRAAHVRASHAVTHWNSIANAALTPSQGSNPMAQSRTLAILHAAIHDAVNAIDRRFEPYTSGLTVTRGASVNAAVAAAARDVLVSLLPEQSQLVEAEYARALQGVHDASSKAAGIALGRAAARATIARRQGDGFETATQPPYVPRSQAGDYQFTSPFAFAAQPGWGHVRPFIINVREHSVDGPLQLSSTEYAEDLAYVKSIGHVTSAIRTPEQSTIAQFWYEDSPLGWNRITNIVVRQKGLDAWSAARAFALVNFAMADGFIAGFDAKYQFRFWRPVTAIHNAATDGNPLTEADSTWQPFLTTPPVPDYPSTHTVLGWAAAEVLIGLFGDGVQYSTTSLTLPGVTRQYQGFSTAAEENGWSRLYAGIHFRHAIEDGRRQGRGIGRAVVEALHERSPR
jgi:PAP2 superfamily protein